MNLGGFAEGPWAVDGDWESFNYCTAEIYYDSMYGEEWDLLGEACFDMIENIAFWLTQDPELGKDYDANAIYTGSFKTINGRTFIDAIIDDRKEDYAEAYIHLHVYDIRLYILCMFKLDEYTINEGFNGTVLNYINYTHMKKDEKLNFLSSIFSELEKIYSGLTEIEEKKHFLNVVYKNVQDLKWYTYGEDVNLNDCISKSFKRVLINKDKKGE